MIRSDCWTQLLTLEEEAAGRSGQRWYCRCGSRYMCRFGVAIEMIDHTADPARGYYMRAECPDEDIRDLKTLLRADKLKRAGTTVLSPKDLLRYLPVVEPMAVGSVFDEYKLNSER